MKSCVYFVSLLVFASLIAFAGEEGMPSMPKISPKKTYTVQTLEQGEDIRDQRGYGDQEPMIRMMNLMMVGGSGYEGMAMSQMNEMQGTHAHSIQQLASNADQQTMDGMNMETEASHPTGHTPSPAEGQTAKSDVQGKIHPDPPVVGVNTFEVSLQDKNTKKPEKGRKLKIQVYALNMDMGTEEPRVRESTPGVYRAKVNFSMKGPWAVKLFLPDGGEKIFDYNVGSKQ